MRAALSPLGVAAFSFDHPRTPTESYARTRYVYVVPSVSPVSLWVLMPLMGPSVFDGAGVTVA